MAGKHEKKIQMEWNEGAAESYTAAEFQRLRSENERLKKEAARMEKIYSKVVNGAKLAIEKWKAENSNLKAEIAQYEKALAKEVVGKHV